MPAHHEIQLVCAYVLILMLRPFFWRIPAADAVDSCASASLSGRGQLHEWGVNFGTHGMPVEEEEEELH